MPGFAIQFLDVALLLYAFLVNFVVSTTLAAVTALNPVALRGLSKDLPVRVGDVEQLDSEAASQRLSLIFAQKGSLLLAVGAAFDLLHRLGVPLAFHVVLIIAFVLIVVLIQGLLVRWLAIRDPRGSLAWSAGISRFISTPFIPIAVVVGRVLQAVPEDSVISEEEREEREDNEVEALIEVGEREGLLEEEEGEMMRGIVDLDETVVREIMTPRADIVALPVESTVAEARRTVIEAGHSRLPVYRGSIDHIMGILYARDLFRAWEKNGDSWTLENLVRRAAFVPETASAAVLLSGMRQKRPIAMVIDEYGGVAGLITLEDLLEEIVGEIHDEHETVEELIRSEDGWSVPAATSIQDVEKLFEIDLGPRGFDTIGGLVVSTFGRVPLVGEEITTRGISVRVLAADSRRVRRVQIRPMGTDEGASSDDD
ncbi:MAG: hemolysin family protein [Acidobacteriota bacterium]|nr:hemolysin family protein [Acidobacteriota bacterium]MDH3786356.1 hemolysin family protein [Acidobacteriota bacterium]